MCTTEVQVLLKENGLCHLCPTLITSVIRTDTETNKQTDRQDRFCSYLTLFPWCLEDSKHFTSFSVVEGDVMNSDSRQIVSLFVVVDLPSTQTI